MNMIASILNGAVLYGVDYSSQGAETIEISDSDASAILSGVSIVDPVSGEVVGVETYEPSDDELIELKRKEMQALIDLRYPLETRLTYINAGILDSADTGFATMNTYLAGIKAEFADNGKDADFSDWE